ncbi:PAS domain S-box protein [Halarchaeum sp. CBA1220]|uniref:PAS domain S-box protein n=1 Tax=Halarchaeum sp. CBA1220 TaxID=1853682 RepID=UPI000F3A96EE|nr:PAS domain S-box protein [Halarchaeum sp. CBA1220]QLC32809.1 PAS domain S-box protein [Halarchaeum sp. CBA1220]
MDATSPRERLYAVFADADLDVEEKIDRALDVGADHLDLPIGFVSRIEDGTQRIAHATGEHDRVQPGETCPLRESYCRHTLESEGLLAVQEAAVSPIDQRAIDAFGLGAYIGAKVVVDGEVYGTVCFASREPRDAAFSESEELFLELLASLVGNALERRAYERDLKERTERLEREKRRFEGIAETSFDILFRVGLDARFTYVSAAVERILGYQPEALTGEYFTEFMTEEAAEDAATAYDRLLAGESVENLELDFRARDGDIVVIAVNATPIDDGGTITGIQGVGRDVTARKERERELRVKNRAMDEADVGISIADPDEPDTPLVYVNDGFERITGYDAEEVIGRNCRFLQGERTDDASVERIGDAIDAEESAVVELVNYRRDGTPFWNRLRVNPVYDERGDLSHYLGFQDDVTERKRTERLIALLNRVLRHNLRNDMTLFLAWGSGLRHGDVEDPRETGERIERAARELSALGEHARELEQYARRDRDPQRLDPRALCEAVRETHRERFPNGDVEVHVAAERDICAGAELREALAELVANGLKHDPSDAPQVSVSVFDAGDWVELVVSDDGPGIDSVEAEVIATGEETALMHGSGLGLWLVNWIVTRYGGSFQIAADDGGGTTATVRLPAIGAGEAVADAERGPTVLFF